MIKRRPKSRLCRVLSIVVILLLLGVWFVWQQESIVTETYSVSSSRLPAAFEGFRIVQLSDLHGKEFGEDRARLLKAVAEADPDIIVLTGDLIDRESQLAAIPTLAEGLCDIAPTYYVTGNHEWSVGNVKELKALLTGCGVTVLSGDYVLLEREGETIVLAGVDDPNGYADQTTALQLQARIAKEVGTDAYTVLLSHRDTVEQYGLFGYDLVFCGHGHGGIFRIPFWDQGLLSTDRTFFPEYDGGLYPLDGGGACLVSRGLGSNTVPFHAFRLFNRPHLPVAVLTAG